MNPPKFSTWKLALGHPITALASAAVLLAVMGSQNSFLRKSWLLYLGKISYGLYVLHEFAHFCASRIRPASTPLQVVAQTVISLALTHPAGGSILSLAGKSVLTIERALCSCAIAACMKGNTKLMQGEAKLMTRAFFNRDPRIVSRELLGKLIVRKAGRTSIAGRIVEVEAYLGAGDLAAHSAAGNTARNAVLWGPPGHAYVYFIYGVHYCLNISCLPDGEAGGILIRALEPVSGIRQMAKARELADLDLTVARDLRKLTSGPGRLAEALGVTRPRDNGKDMVSSDV